MLIESDSEIAHRNAAMIYQSEQSQGKSAFMIGLALAVVGIIYKNWWVVAAGAVVTLVGRARMERAGDAYNAANMTYAKTLGQ